MPASHDAPHSAHGDAPRPLPARPNLEFERRRAKKLLATLRETNADARLGDAQFHLAREYGFASWPKLVEYYEAADRQDRSRMHDERYPPEHLEQQARQMYRALGAGDTHTLALASAFIPRFYAESPDAIPASEITLDDARLILARVSHCPSWAVLIERAERTRSERPQGWKAIDMPIARAVRALREGDFATVGRIVDDHPELLRRPQRDVPSHPGSLLGYAIAREWSSPGSETRRITDWIVARGASLRDELGHRLVEAHHFSVFTRSADGGRTRESRTIVDYVAFLLERGADPTWLPPNRIPVLEHALVRYRNGKAIDLLASQVEPRPAFWIAAGLGDVAAVTRYVDRDGSLRPAARRHRPDLLATALTTWWTQIPNAPDRDIMLEAFFVAATNQRWEVLDVLLDRGFPIDYSPFGASILACFLQPPSIETFEYFMSRGANLDATLGNTGQTLRNWACQVVLHQPDNPDAIRLFKLMGGGDPEVARKRVEEQFGPPKPAVVDAHLEPMFSRASADARRLGRSHIEPDSLFVAVLLTERAPVLAFLGSGTHGADPVRLREALGDRFIMTDEATGANAKGHILPLSASAAAVMAAATQGATARRSPRVTILDMLAALVERDVGPVAELLEAAGGSAAWVRRALQGAL